uniref:Juvenile hormone epoxide hydrolase n=1 Tax=Manduca sexta TaxID=7130 RepID=HYEP_MANSE|nr:RecName: Full=Juvenile hormone epoxide hydrolase; Short=JHEH; AltName: Full=Juvenile hormone-specific epoxide hydrolase [Manduca sexta]AAC47018.1 juvenile hormone epoxide hydrolase [Manduca sexta]prf//2210235A epoxide hydrolase [Manduca sexta]
MYKILSSFVAGVAIGSGLVITYVLYNVPEPPELDLQRWWGIGTRPTEEDKSIRPFSIDFNDTVILDLKERLKNRRPFTKPLEGINSEYGMNTEYLETVLEYWLNEYNFKKRAELLNKFPHYKTRIQGLDLHFIRVKPEIKEGVQVLPLLMMHGWPSSSKEFDKVIPILTTPKHEYNIVFEVVAVDLPGYGFSEGTNKPGLNPVQIGVMMRNLMLRLGFEKFYIQAGDWGSQCATHMATLFPDQVLGLHTNMPLSSRPLSTVKLFIGALFPSLIVDAKYMDRIYPLKNLFSYILRETGYFHIQATKPDTIGVALTDSPAGLAGYLIEKMAICSNRDQLDTPHGGLENLNLDDVLDTVTINWINNCIVTSTRLYAEGFSWPEVLIVHRIPSMVPTAGINFKYEVLYQPDWILRDKFPNLVRSTVLDFGGHFAALHTPQALADDIFASAVQFLKFHDRKRNQKSS